MMRLVLSFLFLVPFLTNSQNFEDSWTGHFSYVSVKSISQGDDKIYVASENAVFTYDLATQEVETISSVNGLSGELISTIYYSKTSGHLVIGYETGLIEIVIDGEENILKVVDILEKQTIPPDKKHVNQFNEYNGNLYIATEYGISVYDLAALEFGDTYFIGGGGSQINIYQTDVQEPYIYAATKGDGVKRAMVDDENLIDYQNWTTIETGTFKGIQTLGNELYALNNNNGVLKYNPSSGFSPVTSYSSTVVDFISNETLLTVTTDSAIQTYAEGFALQASANNIGGYILDLQAGYAFGNNLYLGTTNDGLLVVPFGSNQATQILPDGPIKNRPYSLDATPGQVWVGFGEVDVSFNPYPLSKIGISNLKDETWTNIEYDQLFDANDLVNVSINPENYNEVFMTSFQKGLLKIVDQVPTILYNETNSPLDLGLNNPDVGIRLYGSDFDREGNLWFDQSRTHDGIIKLTPGGQFQKIDISDIINGEQELALTELAVSREGYVFFGSAQNGLLGYNPQTNKFNKIGEGQGNGNLPTYNTRALAFDNQNRLWIGTLKGLRVLFSPGSFFDGGDPESQAIIILEDGVPQELLFEQSISDIEVDGSNNKWVATSSSGVFYLSPNGQETLLRFTKDNSPLPSNTVQDIAIDPFTGVVYFATVNGLVAYKGTATAPQDDLENVYAYPNPVRPGFSGNVTIDGLTAQANVKITDIEGNLVFETTSEGGSVLWDTTAFGNYKVRSGVYLVLITTEDNVETKVSKIMIIR